MLANIASIATLILFVFYFVGRLWTGKKNLHYMGESFSLYPVDNSELEIESELILEGNERIAIKCFHAMEYVDAYEMSYDEHNNIMNYSENRYYRWTNLPSGSKIFIRTILPEGIPNIGIKFKRYDGVLGQFLLGSDGRYGGVGIVEYKLKHSLSSVLYYLVR